MADVPGEPAEGLVRRFGRGAQISGYGSKATAGGCAASPLESTCDLAEAYIPDTGPADTGVLKGAAVAEEPMAATTVYS
jgi:hypothetical protein